MAIITNHCTCGIDEVHEHARRKTVDGIVVVFWSDGGVTDRIGNVGATAARSAARAADWRSINYVIAGNVCALTFAEVIAAVKTARNPPRAPKSVKPARHSNHCPCIGCLMTALKAGQGAPVRLHIPFMGAR